MSRHMIKVSGIGDDISTTDENNQTTVALAVDRFERRGCQIQHCRHFAKCRWLATHHRRPRAYLVVLVSMKHREMPCRQN